MTISAHNRLSISELLYRPSDEIPLDPDVKPDEAEVVSRMPYQFHDSFMISQEIFQNALHIPTPETVYSFLFERRAEVVVEPVEEASQGSYGIVEIFNVPKHELKFVVKSEVDDKGASLRVGGAEIEILCNILIQYHSKLFYTYPHVDVFMKIGVAFIAQYITGIKGIDPSAKDASTSAVYYQLVFEAAPGKNLQDESFILFSEQLIDPTLDIESSRQKFLSENLRITAQLCSALSFIHRIGIVHRDLKLANIVYDRIGENIKLIDFGISRRFGPLGIDLENIALASYCSSLEEYKLAQIGKTTKDPVAIALDNLNSPVVDIYGLGILLPQIFFRVIGWEYTFEHFVRIKHDDFETNIENREHFYQNLEEILTSMNDILPDHFQYSATALNFITKLVKLCLDPIPINRPSAAQVCGLCELFSAGMTEFDQALQFIRELRPAPQPSVGLLAIYDNFDLVPKK